MVSMVAVAVILVALTIVLETNPVGSTLLKMTIDQTDPRSQTSLNVFEIGSLEINTKTIQKSQSSSPPHPLLVVSPKTTGTYPIILFVHGTFLQNYDYSDMFQHIASHGYIVVAPQLWSFLLPSQSEEIEMAASVANWLPKNIQNILPKDVKGDLSKLAVSGHSRGGKTAFALALGLSETKLNMSVSALIGVDPVAGTSKNDRTEPHVLTYKPNSFNLSIPTMVVGTGLGNRSVIPVFGPACAPNEVNYEEFFTESRESSEFVVSEYGHMDMLNDSPSPLGVLASAACVSGKGGKNPIRRSISGILVAYLHSRFLYESDSYVDIINNPSLAPAKLFIKVKTMQHGEVPHHSQV